MKIERTSKEKREKNALYLMHSNSNMIALVVDRVSSSSLNRVRLIANIYKSASYPEVVGESVSDGVMGAFYEFLGFLNKSCLPDFNLMYSRDFLNKHLETYYHFHIIYDDGFVILLQR